MEGQEINTLLAKFEKGECNERETAMLETWYLQYGLDSTFEISADELETSGHKIWERLLKETRSKTSTLWIWPKITAAALILITFSATLFFYFSKDLTDFKVSQHNDLAPGRNFAILKLSDGTEVTLDDQRQGKIAHQSGATISKGIDGQLVYEQDTELSQEAAVYNTIEIPRGGKYQLTLPDGTKVWLNAASRLKYPTSFNHLKERRVELDGEAFFQVTKNKQQPFLVMSRDQVLEVTGTQFNVNSYNDEPAVKTTLIEGSVNVNLLKLRPGQQAIVTNKDAKVIEVSTEVEIAWKNGEFIFENEELQSILRKLSRWYDLDVIYQARPGKTLYFDGELSRQSNLSAIITMLENTSDMKFELKGRRLILTK